MSGQRHTVQRDIVFQEVCRTQGHATADMLYDGIHVSHPSISRATVYRNLKTLEKLEKVMRIEIPGEADYFEVRNPEHYHIKCMCCGGIFDAALPYMPQLLTLAQEADAEFELSACQLLLQGLCPDCRKKQGK